MEHLPIEEYDKIMSKYNDFIVFVFENTSPRATVCHIIFKKYPYERNRHGEWIQSHAYGVTIRKKSDEENSEFAKSLALKRAIKQYKKIKREQRNESR